MNTFLLALKALKLTLPIKVRIKIAVYCRSKHKVIVDYYSLYLIAARTKNINLTLGGKPELILRAALEYDWAEPFTRYESNIYHVYAAIKYDCANILKVILPEEITNHMIEYCFANDSIKCFKLLDDSRPKDFLFPSIGEWNCPKLAVEIADQIDQATFVRFCANGHVDVVELIKGRFGFSALEAGWVAAVKNGKQAVRILLESKKFDEGKLHYDY